MLCAHKASISWRANPVVTMLSTVLSTIWLSPCSNEPRTTQGIKQKIQAAIWAQHGLFASDPDFDITFGLAYTIEKSAPTTTCAPLLTTLA